MYNLVALKFMIFLLLSPPLLGSLVCSITTRQIALMPTLCHDDAFALFWEGEDASKTSLLDLISMLSFLPLTGQLRTFRLFLGLSVRRPSEGKLDHLLLLKSAVGDTFWGDHLLPIKT